MSKRLPLYTVQRNIRKLVEEVQENKRIILTRYGYGVAALVSIEDLKKIEESK